MSESVFGHVDEATLLARMNAVVDEDEGGHVAAPPQETGSVLPAPAPGADPGPEDPFAFVLTGPPQT